MTEAPPSLSAHIREAAHLHRLALEGFFATHTDALAALSVRLAACFRARGKLLLCGNGGSACDAMHIAGEFVGRFQRKRRGLPALALSADSGILTALGNDYGFERIFARQVEALAAPGDLLIALSTSGGSANILEALRTARAHGLHTVLLTGENGKDRATLVDELYAVPSTDTARIQEVHLTALHILTGLVETALAEDV
jgi:D-sedoheptulose 7-phosphate isomerase